jgi:hypothetical protein
MEHQFEGGQLTPEEFYQNQSIPITERPLTGAEGGRVYDTRKYLQGGRVQYKPGGIVEPGVTHYGRTISDERRKILNKMTKAYAPGKKWADIKDKNTKTKIQKAVERQKAGILPRDEAAVQIGREKRIKTFNTNPRVKQLRWIVDNAKNYKNPKVMISAFEKRFDVKNFKNASLFKNAMRTGSEARGNIAQYIDLSILELGDNPLKVSGTKTFTFRPGNTEDTLFKSAIIQKNKGAFNDFKTALKNIDADLTSLRTKRAMEKLTIEETLKLLNKRDYKVLENFGFIRAEGDRVLRPFMRGLFKDSLENQNLNMNHWSSFKSVITPFTHIERLISNLSNPKIAKEWGLNASDAKKVQNGWKNVSKGQAQAAQWVDNLETKIGNNKFKKIFGEVIFEHQLAKQFGKNWKFLPRDYLLRGQMGNQAFNIMKLKTYDRPIANLIGEYEKASKAGNTKLAKKLMGQIEDLHGEFNRITGNYMKDYTPSFKKGKFEWKSSVDPFSKKTLHRYDIPGVAGKEMAQVSLGMEKLGTASKDVFGKRQVTSIEGYVKKQDKFANLLSKNLDNLDDATQKLLGERLGCKVGASSGGRIGFSPGGVVDCLKSKLKQNPKSFLQNIGQTAAKTKNANILNFLKTGRNIARGTGIFAMWEAAFAPIIIGWMGSEGESGKRITHEVVYGPLLEAIGVSPDFVPGISEKEEKIKHYGQSGYNLSRIDEIGEEYSYLQAQRDAEINKWAHIEGFEGTNMRHLENKMKELQGEYSQIAGTFYEGPAGQHLGEEKVGQAIQDLDLGEFNLMLEKEARKKEGYGGIFADQLDPTEEMLGLQAGGKVDYDNYLPDVDKIDDDK